MKRLLRSMLGGKTDERKLPAAKSFDKDHYTKGSSFREFLVNHRSAKKKFDVSKPKFDSPNHAKAVDYYAKGSALLNRAMRRGMGGADPFMKTVHKHIMQTAHASKTETPMVLHRGIQRGEHRHYHVGKEHDVHNFLSTTTHPHIANWFGDMRNNSRLRIKVPKGTPHIAMGNLHDNPHKHEREVLLPPGKLHIHKQTKTKTAQGEKVTIYHAHYVPHHHDVTESELMESWSEFRKSHKEHKKKMFKNGPKTKGDDERVSVMRYTASWYKQINNHLMNSHHPEDYVEPPEVLDAHAKNIKSVLKRHKTKEPMVVYRGLRHGHETVHESGSVHDHQAFISTSTSPTFATNWSRNTDSGKKHILRIKVPRGSKALHPKTPGFENEKEVLLHPGKIKVSHTTHTKIDGHKTVVHHAHYEAHKDE